MIYFEREYRKFSKSREFLWGVRAIRPIRIIRVKDCHFVVRDRCRLIQPIYEILKTAADMLANLTGLTCRG